jgi:hypothetical protein
MKHITIIVLSLFFFNIVAQSQSKITYKKTEIQSFPKFSTTNISDIETDFNPVLLYEGIPSPINESDKSKLQRIKEQIPNKIKGVNNSSFRATIDKPHRFSTFEGNAFNGHPNDNDMAISNDGKIVSVTNSVIYVYDETGNELNKVSLAAFVDSLPSSKYDPKVLYDPLEDKFIICFLNGYTDNTSQIFFAFSQTNDPTKDWNIYTIPGNPLNDVSWSDFPMIALTKDEMFFTINLLKNNEHWKTGFKQTIIWQIDKNTGFDGDDSLKARLYHDISFEGTNIRNLCPVHAAMEPAGPNMYFLSNRNFSLETDSFFMVEITGKMTEPSTKLEVNLVQSDINYGVPPAADQPFNKKLETNDARVLDAYYLNGMIHYVGNTVNFKNNYASIYHGKLNPVSKSNNLKIFHDPSLEFGYPSIEFSGKTVTEDEAIIWFNHSSDSVAPGISCLFYKEGDYSDLVTIKQGESHVVAMGSPTQRWGDYTGLQRKYNEDGIVWGSGYYGKNRGGGQAPFLVNSTWIGQVRSPTYASTQENIIASSVKTFPNPVEEKFYIEFEMQNTDIADFLLYDMKGNLIKNLMQKIVKKGKNTFIMDVQDLPAGSYVLSIQSNGNVISSKVLKK